MKKNKREEQPQEKFYVDIKDEFKGQYQKKKQTQRNAHDRRQQIRELKEERDWN